MLRPQSTILHSEGARIHRLLIDHLASVTRYLGRLGVAPGEIDDVAQETFIVASAKISGVPVERESAFLYTTAAHVAQNVRRATFRRQRAHDLFIKHEPDPVPSPEQLTDGLQTRTLADAILRDMSTELRAVFVLFEIEGLAIPEIAERLSLATGTVASRLRRARKEFFDRLGRASVPRRAAGTPRASSRVPWVDDGAPGPELLSWWVSDGEVEALGALVGIYRRGHPGASVQCSGIRDTNAAKQHLISRMVRGAPPDMFQCNGGRDLLRWALHGDASGLDHIESLEFLFEDERWRSSFSEEVLDLVSCAGEAYAVPLAIHRINTLSYDLNAFARAEVEVPRTLDDLYASAEALQKRGVTPLALGTREPWVLSLLAFECILVALAGPRFYRDFFEGRASPRATEIREALAQLGHLLDVANPDASTLGWDRAADRLRIGSAAMTLMGDWTKGYLSRRGYLEGEGFGVAPAPGTEGTFVFTVDAFGLPRRASRREGAIELLRIFGSEQGQTVFSRIKGSRPARKKDPLRPAGAHNSFDSDVRVPTLTSLIPPDLSDAIDAAMAEFASSRDPEVVIGLIERHYARLL